MISTNQPNWHPTATLESLQHRANIINKIRNFFETRNFLEVETPILSQATVTDPNLNSFTVNTTNNNYLYLQTSPEFHMKRLLAAGSGPIYQIGKAFRSEELGRLHNPEFTLLEWYRPDYDHHDLMNEVNELLIEMLDCKAAERLSYQDIFLRYLDINPHAANTNELIHCAQQHNINAVGIDTQDKDSWLNVLLTHVIEPNLGINQPTFIYDYPITQAALAKIRKDNIPVAERFEVYINGIELANGFHELCDSQEQKIRFVQDLKQREELGLSQVTIDNNFLEALDSGLPNCAGVALGIDRLIMLATKVENISQTMSFNIENA